MTEIQAPPAQEPVPFVVPRGEMVCVLPLQEETDERGDRHSAGGVVLLQLSDTEPIEGVVVAVGGGAVQPISAELAQRLAFVALEYADYEHGHRVADEVTRGNLAALLIAESEKPRPFDVKVGDRILYDEVHATSIILGDVTHELVPESAILGLVENVGIP